MIKESIMTNALLSDDEKETMLAICPGLTIVKSADQVEKERREQRRKFFQERAERPLTQRPFAKLKIK